jgi:NTP pyrophosphatase (non-canonical NTP hydrolase)
MNENEVRQLYHTAWKHWGADAQVDMLIEEMAELTQALLKTRRNKSVFSHAVFEEMADVSICLDQLVKKIEEMKNEDTYLDQIDFKLNRLKERLMKSMGGKYPVTVTELTP